MGICVVIRVRTQVLALENGFRVREGGIFLVSEFLYLQKFM